MRPSHVIQAMACLGCLGVVIYATATYGARGLGVALAGVGFGGALLSPFFTYLARALFDD